MRVINTIKDLDSKGMPKFDLNKEKAKKRISLLQLLKLADVIVFSDTFSLLSGGCHSRVKRRLRKVLSLLTAIAQPLLRDKYLKPEPQ